MTNVVVVGGLTQGSIRPSELGTAAGCGIYALMPSVAALRGAIESVYEECWKAELAVGRAGTAQIPHPGEFIGFPSTEQNQRATKTRMALT